MTKVWQVSWVYIAAALRAGRGRLRGALFGRRRPGAYASRHVLRFAFGLVMMLSIAMVDIRFIARFSYVVYGISIALLVLVLRMGHVGKGAQRWIELGGLQLQPSELAKIGLVMALAAWFHKASWERIGNPLFLMPPALMVLVPVGLILKEPNLGTAVITAIVGGAVILAAGSAGGRCCWSPSRCRSWRNTRSSTCTTTSAPASPPSSTPRATRSAPATTSSSRRSHSGPAGSGARASCRARRAT